MEHGRRGGGCDNVCRHFKQQLSAETSGSLFSERFFFVGFGRCQTVQKSNTIKCKQKREHAARTHKHTTRIHSQTLYSSVAINFAHFSYFIRIVRNTILDTNKRQGSSSSTPAPVSPSSLPPPAAPPPSPPMPSPKHPSVSPLSSFIFPKRVTPHDVIIVRRIQSVLVLSFSLSLSQAFLCRV